MDIKYQFIRKEIEKGNIKLKYLPTTQMPADTLTKALPRETFNKYKDKLMCE